MFLSPFLEHLQRGGHKWKMVCVCVGGGLYFVCTIYLFEISLVFKLLLDYSFIISVYFFEFSHSVQQSSLSIICHLSNQNETFIFKITTVQKISHTIYTFLL